MILHHFIMRLFLEILRDASIVVYVLVVLSQWIQQCSQSKKKRTREPPTPTWIPVQPVSDKISFQNSTDEPYNPSIDVSEALWSILNGDNATDIVHTPDKRPLGTTALIATVYLRENFNGDYFIIVQELLEETKKIARDCLAETRGEKRHLFRPDTMRSLQLISNLGEELGYEIDGTDCKGILRTFEDEVLLNGEHKYTLMIEPLHGHPAGLPLIALSLSSRKWFTDSCGITFKLDMPEQKLEKM